MRLWMKALGTFLIITAMGLGMDRLLIQEGVPRLDLQFLSNALVGLVAAALVVAVARRQKQREQFVSSHMRVISEMNHHIRNALQVISFTPRGERSEPEMQAMQMAVKRISWALREVLPKLLTPEDEKESETWIDRLQVDEKPVQKNAMVKDEVPHK